MGLRSFIAGGATVAVLYATQGTDITNITKLISHESIGQNTGEKTESVSVKPSVPPVCDKTTHNALQSMLLNSDLRKTHSGPWYDSETYNAGQGLGYWHKLGETSTHVLRLSLPQDIRDTQIFRDRPDHLSNLNAGVVEITAVDKKTNLGIGIFTKIDFTNELCYRITENSRTGWSTAPDDTVIKAIHEAKFSLQQ